MKSLEHYYILFRRMFIRPIMNNHKLSAFIARHCLKTHMKMFYENWLGKRLNLSHPQDMNHQLMKLSFEAYNDPIQHKLRVQCADKYRVREYVTSKGLEDILIPSYGVFDNFDEIDFDKLPNQFVIQSNFGCGHIWICKDKEKELADIEKWRKQFNEWMAITDFGLSSSEWQYSEMPHKLVITKYLDSLGAISVNDYKFHCMHGKVYGCFAAYDRQVGVDHGRNVLVAGMEMDLVIVLQFSNGHVQCKQCCPVICDLLRMPDAPAFTAVRHDLHVHVGV